jgi:hypothetical protein
LIRLVVGIANLLIGTVYTGYGFMTLADLKRGYRDYGLSHFGMAWLFMAFTCGPHHLAHAVHIAGGRTPGGLEALAVIIGIPPGVTWFLLRIEALRGGPGDRPIAGTPLWLKVCAVIYATYVGVFAAVTLKVAWSGSSLTPKMTPNILLVVLYCAIGYYLFRTQFASHARGEPWSLSGLSLSTVFPTCAAMHAAFLLYATQGNYAPDPQMLAIDWLSVPAAAYFVWVVRCLYRGTLPDWNLSAREPIPAREVVA